MYSLYGEFGTSVNPAAAAAENQIPGAPLDAPPLRSAGKRMR
ncbi:hypothetical protein VSK91_07825 [Bacillus swezeyi]